MKMRIKEFSEFVGVSVRTLHYYDEIGLLRPAEVDRITGYRFYDEKSLLRMQEILFYRELDFSLKSISEILSSSNYNKTEVFQTQKKMLVMKKERLERLISAIDEAEKGEYIVKAFDNSEFERYKVEAQEKWGNTDAYKEYTEKTKDYRKDTWRSLASDMDIIFSEFSVCMKKGFVPSSEASQSLVKKLQNHITENYYNCTKEILSGLGQMYVIDERFKSNIDKHVDGTAAYVSEAISCYCKK